MSEGGRPGTATPVPERRPGRQWAQITSQRIVDPDGWRSGDDVSFDRTPITLDDFHARLAQSTIDTRRTHNPWDSACGRRLHGEPTHPLARCALCREPRPFPHTYDRDPVNTRADGSYQCTCGDPLISPIHPHQHIDNGRGSCVCLMPRDWPGHL